MLARPCVLTFQRSYQAPTLLLLHFTRRGVIPILRHAMACMSICSSIMTPLLHLSNQIYPRRVSRTNLGPYFDFFATPTLPRAQSTDMIAKASPGQSTILIAKSSADSSSRPPALAQPHIALLVKRPVRRIYVPLLSDASLRLPTQHYGPASLESGYSFRRTTLLISPLHTLLHTSTPLSAVIICFLT